jgi:hypothetical protein
MIIEDIHFLYTEIIIACVQLRQTIGDEFFVKILDYKLRDFTNAFVRVSNSPSGHNAAQDNPRLRAIDSLLELLSQLEHLNIGDHLRLLTCREFLLKAKLSVIREPNRVSAKQENAETALPPEVPFRSKAMRFPERTKKANQVREEVLKFIQFNHQARTKDITNQFSAISYRTILRSLKELVNQGVITRQSEGKNVQYMVK